MQSEPVCWHSYHDNVLRNSGLERIEPGSDQCAISLDVQNGCSRSAKPIFMGSNPIRCSNIIKHLLQNVLNPEQAIIETIVGIASASIHATIGR
jgi:hypothetical protein